LPDTPLPLAANQVAFFRITVQIPPEDALSGHYSGTVTVTVTVNGLPIALPPALDVWSFALPPERHLNVTIETQTDTGRHIAKRHFRLIEKREAGESQK